MSCGLRGGIQHEVRLFDPHALPNPRRMILQVVDPDLQRSKKLLTLPTEKQRDDLETSVVLPLQILGCSPAPFGKLSGMSGVPDDDFQHGHGVGFDIEGGEAEGAFAGEANQVPVNEQEIESGWVTDEYWLSGKSFEPDDVPSHGRFRHFKSLPARGPSLGLLGPPFRRLGIGPSASTSVLT